MQLVVRQLAQSSACQQKLFVWCMARSLLGLGPWICLDLVTVQSAHLCYTSCVQLWHLCVNNPSTICHPDGNDTNCSSTDDTLGFPRNHQSSRLLASLTNESLDHNLSSEVIEPSLKQIPTSLSLSSSYRRQCTGEVKWWQNSFESVRVCRCVPKTMENYWTNFGARISLMENGMGVWDEVGYAQKPDNSIQSTAGAFLK